MTVGIFYICTGKYSIFWETFYKSAEKYLLPDCTREYFVFTDDEKILPTEHIHVYYERAKGFPLDSLLRFELFLRVEDDTKNCDYLYFFNSNMQFIRTITVEMFLPTEAECGLAALRHPGYYNKGAFWLPYERRKKSMAFIPYSRKDTSYKYYMGSLNGGMRDEYLKLIKECRANVQKDFDNDVMAIYHDESHLNRYLHGKNIKELSPAFGFPEHANLPFEPYCVILNKMEHGGKYFDKLPKTAYALRLRLFVKRVYTALKWRLGL